MYNHTNTPPYFQGQKRKILKQERNQLVLSWMDRVFLKNMSNRLTITYANDFSAQKYKKHLEYARILRKKCVFL